MIVFNLRCDAAHPFEGWFRSLEDYEGQRARNLVACPVCGSEVVERTLTAPRLNFGAAENAAPVPAAAPPMAGDIAVAALMQHLRERFKQAENVGPRFAEEARRIHYQEAPARSIRGEASGEEYRELQEEGIEVMPLPRAWVPDENLN